MCISTDWSLSGEYDWYYVQYEEIKTVHYDYTADAIRAELANAK